MTADRAARSIAGEGEALEIAGITDRGPVRTQNQDVWDAHIRAGGRTALLALADGMGGHKGGLEAAEAAVTAAMATLLDAGPPATRRARCAGLSPPPTTRWRSPASRSGATRARP